MRNQDEANGIIREVTLAGNPNVGKSTVFNLLTGMHQHTGNWPGKTVEFAEGKYTYKGEKYRITDLPGTYSFKPDSQDEAIAGEYIKNHPDNCTVIVCDATALERSLILALQTAEICPNTVLCVNLMDEAVRKGICINLQLLERRLNIPVIGTSVKDKKSKAKLLEAIKNSFNSKPREKTDEQEKDIIYYVEKAEQICHGVITLISCDPNERDRKIDKIILGKYTGVPFMLLMLGFIFYLTLTFAGYPSELLSDLFDKMLKYLHTTPLFLNMPQWLSQMLLDGMLNVLSWVVAVMLPPMAIFFPLFTLLEDLGYLPRVAFSLDNRFRKCGTCGKQALSMCMGLGCNCAGITGCRIISSKREKLIAIITNTFTPCNGRFPIIIAIITMFFVSSASPFSGRIRAAGIFVLLMLLSVGMTFLVSKLLSKTLLKGEPDVFSMELPPYRKPEIGRLIVRSVLDRTIFVLGRAVSVAAPAGIIIWLTSHVTIGSASIFEHITQFLEPLGKLMGLDGTILTGFILGLPANEIVIPIIMMGYMAKDVLTDYSTLSELKEIFVNNGWTWITAACTLIFSIFHWPCSTAIITIKKETASLKWTAVSIAIPTLIGIVMCILFNLIAGSLIQLLSH